MKPLRAVVKRKWCGYRETRFWMQGRDSKVDERIIENVDYYPLTLECGHEQIRPTSTSQVRRARCGECE